jgi:hypothetical protein
VPKRLLIGNNGCYFELNLSRFGNAPKSVYKPTKNQPPAAKKQGRAGSLDPATMT